MSDMKRYTIEEQETQMVSEAAVAYSCNNEQVTDVASQWGETAAPCQFSPEELHTVLLQSLDEKKNGRVHPHADVQGMINSRIEAWR